MQKMMHAAAAEAHEMFHLRADMMVSREAFRRRERRFPEITAASRGFLAPPQPGTARRDRAN